MIRLSFSTLGCPDWDLTRVMDQAARLGYDGVELRFLEKSDALWERTDLRGDGLRETRARLADAGLAVSCVDSRAFFHHQDPQRRRAAVEDAVRAAEIAVGLGAPGIRVFGDRVQPGADLVSTRAWISESLAALRDWLRGTGVEVWLETHGDFARAADSRALVTAAGGQGIGVLWDPVNAYSEFGEEPEAGGLALGALLRHVHVKDARRPAEAKDPAQPWTPVLPGRGDCPAARVLTWLDSRGYDGWASFEWEKRWHPRIEEPEEALPHFVAWASRVLRESREPARRAPSATESGGARVLTRGRLAAHVYPDREPMGRAAARLVADHVRASIARDGRAAVIFASAPSQNEFLAALREEKGLDWSRLSAFHLDEYIGIGPDHPASFRRFLIDRLFSRVKVAAFHGLDGRAPDPQAECQRYAALLAKERPSLAVLGIGENGHLAFIDPPVCDFREPLDVRVVELDERCRLQQVSDGGFSTIEEVPRTALSLSIPFLLRVPRAVAIVPGPRKREAIRAALDGPVTRACPASILRRHPDATLFLDAASAAGLGAPHPSDEPGRA